MKGLKLFLCAAVVACFMGCRGNGCVVNVDGGAYNEIVSENGLKIIYPNFAKIDLVCGTMPSKSDTAVILVVEAAYTEAKLDKFVHANIAGDHVSGGVRYGGYKCDRNTGAFVYYNDGWKFCHKRYSHELDSAALYGGAAFAQELIMMDGELLETGRRDLDCNVFRALCEREGRLCIMESESWVTFGRFKKKLQEAGVENAIYLDMGSGWNYSWLRSDTGVVELHPKEHDYCTNWITFYK